MSSKRHIVILACAAALGGVNMAAAAPQLATSPERSLENAALGVRYELLTEQARRLGAAPKQSLLEEPVVTERELRNQIGALAERVDEAREERKYQASGGQVAGVSVATLDAIASCESGGDPTAVNAAGYYGKYQFDEGTWASVGGSGNPAEASEAEQDYRAALLYSRAGSSPWPVCGA